MSITLKRFKAIVDARLAQSRKCRLDSVDLGQGFHLRKDGARLLIVQDGDPQAAEVCGSISPDGEWQIWPVWYEVIAEVLGAPLPVDPQSVPLPTEVDVA